MSKLALRTGSMATRVPALRLRCNTPAAARSVSARLTVALAQPNSSAKASSDGISPPGGQMRARMRCITSARIASQPFSIYSAPRRRATVAP